MSAAYVMHTQWYGTLSETSFGVKRVGRTTERRKRRDDRFREHHAQSVHWGNDCAGKVPALCQLSGFWFALASAVLCLRVRFSERASSRRTNAPALLGWLPCESVSSNSKNAGAMLSRVIEPRLSDLICDFPSHRRQSHDVQHHLLRFCLSD